MSTQTVDQATEGALASQAMFEAMFPPGYTPKTDTRLPADVPWTKIPRPVKR